MKNNLRTSRKQGFTLLEMIVVIGVLGVLTTLGAQAFTALTTSWNHTRSLTELTHSADDALNLIGRDVQDILSAKLSGQSIIGEERTTEKDHGADRDWDEDDRVVFPIQGISSGLSLQKSSTVQYAVQRGASGQFLIRTIGALESENPQQNPLNIIPEVHTNRFRVEYNDGQQWVGSWNSNELPKAIRVSITVAHSQKEFLQISRKRVFPVKVQ